MADSGDMVYKTEKVGDFTVTVQERKSETKKIGSLITIHDIGLNRHSFDDFFHNEYNAQFLDKFVVYHIEIPGQEKDAAKFETDYEFPPLTTMAHLLFAVLEHYDLKDVIGLGVGAGAVILMNLAMTAPDKFLGITVIDPAGKSSGFKEWGEQKLAVFTLEKKGFTSFAEKFLIWHLFGTKGKNSFNVEIVDKCIKDISANQCAYNLSQYVKAYVNRVDIINEVSKLKCRVLIITSAYSPYREEANNIAKKLSVGQVSVLESSQAINVFFEDPGKCGEGMLLLMQGLGLVPTLRTRTASRGGPVHRTASMSED